MCTDSSRYLRSNTLNHLVKSHVGTSHVVIKADLVDKIVYNIAMTLLCSGVCVLIKLTGISL
jgi:hypothetical protein